MAIFSGTRTKRYISITPRKPGFHLENMWEDIRTYTEEGHYRATRWDVALQNGGKLSNS